MASSVADQPDYGWFTPDDVKRLFQAIHQLPDWRTAVLVGGQALTTWVRYFNIALPPFDGPYLTQDADFLGTKADAEILAKYLKGKSRPAHIDDHTVNTALIEFTGQQGQRLQIDMLGMVLGLSNDDVRNLAVPIQWETDWEPVQVMHPLLVLESRCANLQVLASKRTGNGITQAKVAVQVARAYLNDCLSTPMRRREAFKAARKISSLARSRSGIYVWKRFDIDVLAAIDERRMPGLFIQSWQHDLQKIRRKREIAARLPRRPSIG